MQSDISFSRLKQFPLLMWILLLGSFLTRGSYYMVWPFLAVILYEKFALSATEIGLILSIAAVVSVFVSFIGSALSDKFGRHKLMYATGFLYIFSFSLLAQADSILAMVTVITLCAMATSLWRPLTSALIGDIISDLKTRELAMQSLYFVINVGCAIGPIVGVSLGLTGKQSSFYLTTVAFSILLLLLFWGFSHQNRKTKQAVAKQAEQHNDGDVLEEKTKGIKNTINVLMQDKLLQTLIVANILCMFVYGQMDSSLIQYLTRADVPEVTSLFASLIFTNAMIIISCQFILLRLMAAYDLVARIKVGLVLLAASQFWMAINPVNLFWGWIGAVIIMSLAETILFPSMNVHIDRIAPNHLRGAYFGAATFYEFGFALAPLGGGLLLDWQGGSFLFLVCTILVVVVLFLYYKIDIITKSVDNQKVMSH